jgi:mono/diheme cytochrome c family protein
LSATQKYNLMKIKSLTVIAAAAVMTVGASVRADGAPLPPASTQTGVTYATDIKPIFDASCIKCHSGDHAKARLKLDTLEGALKGSKDGPVITVGNSAESDLVKSVAHASDDQDDWMPPLHNKAGIKPLTSDQVGLIRAWIDQGAK